MKHAIYGLALAAVLFAFGMPAQAQMTPLKNQPQLVQVVKTGFNSGGSFIDPLDSSAVFVGILPNLTFTAGAGASLTVDHGYDSSTKTDMIGFYTNTTAPGIVPLSGLNPTVLTNNRNIGGSFSLNLSSGSQFGLFINNFKLKDSYTSQASHNAYTAGGMGTFNLQKKVLGTAYSSVSDSVHALVFKSSTTPGTYYIGFESSPDQKSHDFNDVILTLNHVNLNAVPEPAFVQLGVMLPILLLFGFVVRRKQQATGEAR